MFYKMIRAYLFGNGTSTPLQNYPIANRSNNTINLGKDLSRFVIDQENLIAPIPIDFYLVGIYGPKFSPSINAVQSNSKGELIDNLSLKNFNFSGKQFTNSNVVYIQGFIFFNNFGTVIFILNSENAKIEGKIYINNKPYGHISNIKNNTYKLNCYISNVNPNTDSVFLNIKITKIAEDMKITAIFKGEGMFQYQNLTEEMFWPVERIIIKKFNKTIKCYQKYIKGSECVEECDLNQFM